MAYGIEIRNPGGIISIDGNFKNFQVFSSFTVNTPNTFMWLPQYRPMPLIFYRPFSYGTEIYFDPTYDHLVGSPGTLHPTEDGYRFPTGNFVLALPIATGTSGETHGIRIWDGAGAVVFD